MALLLFTPVYGRGLKNRSYPQFRAKGCDKSLLNPSIINISNK